jgi:tetratricopeptide (TPR) repeat protein
LSIPKLCRIVLAVFLCAALTTAAAGRQFPTGDQSGDAAVAEAIELARAQFADGRYADVIHTLNRATESKAEALVWRGRAHLELGDVATAASDLGRAVALAPRDSEAHRWLGRAYGEEAARARSLSLAGRVRAEFEEAVRLDPSNIAAHRDLLQFHIEAPWLAGGRDGRAQREVAAIAALDPVAGHLARGVYLKHHGDLRRAAAEYRAVLDSGRASLDDLFEAAEFYEQIGDVSGIRRVLQAVAGTNVADPRILYYTGAVDVMSRADPAAAESSLKAYLAVPARSDRPGAVQTHEWLGRLYEFVGSRAKAVAEYAKVLALGRKSAKEALHRLEQD